MPALAVADILAARKQRAHERTARQRHEKFGYLIEKEPLPSLPSPLARPCLEPFRNGVQDLRQVRSVEMDAACDTEEDKRPLMPSVANPRVLHLFDASTQKLNALFV